MTKTVVSWQIYQSPGVALNKGGRVNEHMLVTKNIQPGDVPTRSLFTLYGALLSVMEVCVRLNFPDNSCQTLNASRQLSERICPFRLSTTTTHPGKKDGFPRVTQSDQKNGTSDSFTGEKVLQEH